MDKLYVVMPAYNEAENIEEVVRQWYPIVEKYDADKQSRLVIVNDGSRDQTSAIIKGLLPEHPLLELIEKPNSGHGPTLIMAYQYAIRSGADYIFQTDSDLQTDPAEFDAFWDARNDHSAIFGSRPNRGDGRIRAFVEKVVCFLLKIYFGLNVPDANAPFRLMKADVLSKYLKRLPEDYNLPNIMLTTYFSYYREAILFKQISFSPREKGKNSINIRKIIIIGWNALKDFRRFKREMRENPSPK